MTLTKNKKAEFFAIIRENKYSNIEIIHFRCHSKGISVSKDKLALYAKKLKKEDAVSVRKKALLRRRKIKVTLSKIRTKESLLLKELNQITRQLNKKQQPA